MASGTMSVLFEEMRHKGWLATFQGWVQSEEGWSCSPGNLHAVELRKSLERTWWLILSGAEDLKRWSWSPWTESISGRDILHYQGVVSDGHGIYDPGTWGWWWGREIVLWSDSLPGKTGQKVLLLNSKIPFQVVCNICLLGKDIANRCFANQNSAFPLSGTEHRGSCGITHPPMRITLWVIMVCNWIFLFLWKNQEETELDRWLLGERERLTRYRGIINFFLKIMPLVKIDWTAKCKIRP